MAREYAHQQPQGFKNCVENVAIVGAGGTVGSHLANALIVNGKHKVTALTRADRVSNLPADLHAVRSVDHNNYSALVGALRGQEVLIITLSAGSPNDRQTRVIDAAIEAGVRYIMPTWYSGDHGDTSVARNIVVGDAELEMRKYLEHATQNTKTHWVWLSCSISYEHSLAGGEAQYGFDFLSKTLTMFDDGNTRICSSTMAQCGRTAAKLFALPVLPLDANDDQLTLSQFDDKPILITSFVVSQRDMFESVLRVTGNKDSDWIVTYESSQERYQRAQQLMQSGDPKGSSMLLYAHVFHPNGGGDYSDRVVNHVLGMPKEDLDRATKVGIELAIHGWT